MCKTTNSDSFKHLVFTVHKEAHEPNSFGTRTFFFFLDKCYQDATFDYSSFSNWDPIQAPAISPLLSGLDRSNFLVLMERFFFHCYNLNRSSCTQRHQMCPSVPQGYLCICEINGASNCWTTIWTNSLKHWGSSAKTCSGLFVQNEGTRAQKTLFVFVFSVTMVKVPLGPPDPKLQQFSSAQWPADLNECVFPVWLHTLNIGCRYILVLFTGVK